MQLYRSYSLTLNKCWMLAIVAVLLMNPTWFRDVPMALVCLKSMLALLVLDCCPAVFGHDTVVAHVMQQIQRVRCLSAQGVPCSPFSPPRGDLPLFTAARTRGGDSWLDLHSFPALNKARGVIMYWFGLEARLIVYEPSLYLDAFSLSKSSCFTKSVSLRYLFGTENIIASNDGDRHQFYRSLTNRLKNVKPFISQWKHNITAAIQHAHCTDGKVVVDAHALLGRMTLASIGQFALGSDSFLDEVKADKVLNSLNWLLDEISGHALSGAAALPFAELVFNLQGRSAHRRVVHESICEIVDSRLLQIRDHGAADQCTYLDDLIAAHLKEPKKLTLDQLHANAMTIVFAGHEMTTNALAWCMYFMGKHTDLQDEARAEVLRANQQHPDVYTKDVLPLLCAIITESMRLIPSVGFLSRRALVDVRLREGTANELFIPQNTLVTFSNYSRLRETAVFGDDAAEFNPKRYLPPNTTSLPTAMFGIGPRGCIGQTYADLQMKVVLATLLMQKRWVIDNSYQHHPLHAVTTRPKYGVPVRMSSA